MLMSLKASWNLCIRRRTGRPQQTSFLYSVNAAYLLQKVLLILLKRKSFVFTKSPWSISPPRKPLPFAPISSLTSSNVSPAQRGNFDQNSWIAPKRVSMDIDKLKFSKSFTQLLSSQINLYVSRHGISLILLTELISFSNRRRTIWSSSSPRCANTCSLVWMHAVLLRNPPSALPK